MTEEPESYSGAPSMFWDNLADLHRRQLAQYGVGEIKRHQALKYFTWGWRWSQLAKSEQFRFLVRHTRPRIWCAAACSPADLSDGAWAGIPWSRADRWLYGFASRLLWEYATAVDGTAQTLRLPEPTMGNPLPVKWRGRLISQDLANSALEIAAIRRALQGREPAAILEVGAGYGRTAYALLDMFPTATYTILDIDPARQISEWYLSNLYPGRTLRFVTPADIPRLRGERFDLILSISSLQEMTFEQVNSYLKLFDETAASGTVYLKQWRSWKNPDDDITLTFDDYPVPSSWKLYFKEASPVQTRFVQAAWHVMPAEAANP